jgi:tetratricopeptide (TPR) repeat protein
MMSKLPESAEERLSLSLARLLSSTAEKSVRHVASQQYSDSLNSLAIDSIRHGQQNEAEHLYRRSLKNIEMLMDSNPLDENIRLEYASIQAKLASLAFSNDNLVDAKHFHSLAVQSMNDLLDHDIKDVDFIQKAARVLSNSARFARRIGNQSEALSLYTCIVDMCQELLQEEILSPSEYDNLWVRGNSFSSLARIMRELGRFEEALEFYYKAAEARQELVHRDPGEPTNLRGLSVSFGNLGKLLSEMGRFEEALEFYYKAVETRQELVHRDPGEPANFRSLIRAIDDYAEREEKSEVDRMKESTLLYRWALEAGYRLLSFRQKNTNLELHLRMLEERISGSR